MKKICTLIFFLGWMLVLLGVLCACGDSGEGEKVTFRPSETLSHGTSGGAATGQIAGAFTLRVTEMGSNYFCGVGTENGGMVFYRVAFDLAAYVEDGRAPVLGDYITVSYAVRTAIAGLDVQYDAGWDVTPATVTFALQVGEVDLIP